VLIDVRKSQGRGQGEEPGGVGGFWDLLGDRVSCNNLHGIIYNNGKFARMLGSFGVILKRINS
jgi:hypothetical protein